MDEFVRGKLNEWGLSEWIKKFEDEAIDEQMFKNLEEEDIIQLIPKVKPRIIFRNKVKELKRHGEATNLTEAQPSTSYAGKRKLPFQGESSNQPTPAKRNHRAELKDKKIQIHLKQIMNNVHAELDKQNTDLNQFLKKSIKDLETDKRKLVGVFGKTGAGKSSLINAVIGERNLLPTGSINACTSVMIKVEANMHNKNYEAEIEFIAKEEWKDEVWSMLNYLENNPGIEKGHDDENEEEDGDNNVDNDDDDSNDNDEYHDIVEKLTALYKDDWKYKSSDELMENKYFKEIPEFLQTPSKKILTRKTAKQLSEELVKYTRSNNEGDKNVGSSCWRLVKCVTVKVPENPLLQYVTLVDLPGNGDRNKSRDTMWKQIVGNCSTVWIVSEINRAASEKESWEILKSANSLLGNGGECRQIHFICTKSDQLEDFHDRSADDARKFVLNKNKITKESVKKEFKKLKKMKHFSFEVFTVSSRWFQNLKHLNPEETEIPKLQNYLQELNDDHSETFNYVSGAHGILSLIHGASLRDVAGRSKDVCEELDRNMRNQLVLANAAMKATDETFDKQLSEGVEKSKHLWEKRLKSLIDPQGKRRRGFHGVLKCLVRNGGIHRPKKKKEININMILSSFLTEFIDEEFRKTFPNETKSGPFNGAINKFSLGTENLKTKYKDVELQLIFLKTEEEKIKTRLSEKIRDRKKRIYLSLTETIEEAMKECYDRAKQFSGNGMQNMMTEAIMNHVQKLENTMFEEAKQAMMAELRSLMEEILRELKDTLDMSIKLSLKTNYQSSPDVGETLKVVQQLYKYLKKYHETAAQNP